MVKKTLVVAALAAVAVLSVKLYNDKKNSSYIEQ